MITSKQGSPQDQILAALKESKEPLSAADLATKTGIPKSQMNFYLQGLKQVGKIESKRKAEAGFGGLDQYLYTAK